MPSLPYELRSGEWLVASFGEEKKKPSEATGLLPPEGLC